MDPTDFGQPNAGEQKSIPTRFREEPDVMSVSHRKARASGFGRRTSESLLAFWRFASTPWGGLGILVVGILGSLPLVVHPWYDWSHTDSATYLQTARSLLAGEGYSHLGLPFHIRPPGFALLIAPVIGAFGLDFYVLNFYVSLLSAAGIALLFVYLRPYLGCPIAGLTGLAIWLNPFFRKVSNQVMAEAPGLTFILGALLIDRWSDRSPSWRREIVLGIIIVLACYVRSIALLLVPAIILSRLLRQLSGQAVAPNWKVLVVERVAVPVLVVLLGLLPWSLRNSAVAPAPPADQTMAWSYATGMLNSDVGDPTSPRVGAAEILQRIPENGLKMAGFLGSRLQSRMLDRRGLVITGLALLGLLGAAWRRRAPAELFVIGVLLLLASYYDFRSRLLLPAFVLLVPAVIEWMRTVLQRFTTPRIAELSCCAAVLLLIITDFGPRAGWSAIAQRHQHLQAQCAGIEEKLGPDALLATSFNWHYGVWLNRPVFSLWFATQRDHGRISSSERVIDKYGINTVVLSRVLPSDRQFLKYFVDRYGVQAEAGPIVVVRVRE